MPEIFLNIVSYLAGVATIVSGYVAYRQLVQGRGGIVLLHAYGTFKMPDWAEENGFGWMFHFNLYNNSPNPDAITNIQIRPNNKALREAMSYFRDKNGWIDLTFHESLEDKYDHKKPLAISGYQYKEINGFWFNQWGGMENRKENGFEESWRLFLDEMHKSNVEYRVCYSNGMKKTYRFKVM